MAVLGRQDSDIPAFDILEDSRVFRVRVQLTNEHADDYCRSPESRPVAEFYTSLSVPYFTKLHDPYRRKSTDLKVTNPDGENVFQVAARNKRRLTALFAQASIPLKATNDWVVVLQDPRDIVKAMTALEWDSEMQSQIVALMLKHHPEIRLNLPDNSPM